MLEPTPAGPENPSRRFEISAIVIIAIGALCLVSLLSDAAGIIGTWLSALLRYVFGSLAVVPPIMLIVHALLSLRAGKRVQYSLKAYAVVSLYLAALCVAHLLVGEPLSMSIAGVRSFSAQDPGGGIIGAFMSTVLIRAVGRAGSWVVIMAWVLISGILLSNTPLSLFVASVFTFLGRIGKGLALGWSDFWRGVRLELTELIGLIRDRRTLRREERNLQEVKAVRSRVRRRKRQKEREAAAAVTEKEPDTAVSTVVADTESMDIVPPVFEERAAEVDDIAPEAESAGMETETPPTDASRTTEPAPAGEVAAAKTAEDEARPEPEPFYRLPPTALLERPRALARAGRDEPNQAAQLEETLARFGIETKVVNVSRGPTVTRYELQPAPGVKVKQITSLADDLALALAAAGIRIEAPVPGKSVVGIEVPNKETTPVLLREVIESEEFQGSDSKLVMALGKDIAGRPVVADLRKLLHVLIAGATGSGKSVCINTIIASILYKALPHEVKLLMVDPKRVELAMYDGIPHLVSPVVTDPKQAAGALRWAVKEMESRYTRFSEVGVRNIDGYNRYVEAERKKAAAAAEEGVVPPTPMPYIIIIIDELADLMMVAQHDVEDSIVRLAQMARAAGMHLIIATQRPSVDVITGLIKANVPSRISFAVASSHDSRTILDMVGAERLLGKGDMLYYPAGANKPMRAQGAFISDKEVQKLTEFWKVQGEPSYVEAVTAEPAAAESTDEVDDELFDDAVRLVIDSNSASISMLQRRFRIGYSRAARLIDMMELKGIVGPYQGSKPREVLVRNIDSE